MSEVNRVTNEQVIEAPTTQTVLEKKFERNSKADTTPSVLNVEKLIFKNTGAVLVTKFDDGQPNQEVSCLGDGFTTIQNNLNIVTATGANELLAAGLVYRFTYFAGKWHEDAGSGGGGGGAGPAGPGGAAGKSVISLQEPPQYVEPFVFPGRAGAAGTAGSAGKAGRDIVGLDGRDAPEHIMVPGRDGKAGAAGRTVVIPGLDGRDGAEPFHIPGRDGKAGTAGGAGAAGKTVVIPGIDGRDAEPPMVIPGKPGTAGGAGATGATGKSVIIPGLDGRDAPEPMVIPGTKGATGAAGGGLDPLIASYAPGTFVVPTGKFAQISRRLILTGAQRVTVQGTGALRID